MPPHRRVSLHQIERAEALEIELALLLFGRVAGEAIFLEERLDAFLENLPLITKERGSKQQAEDGGKKFHGCTSVVGSHSRQLRMCSRIRRSTSAGDLVLKAVTSPS